MRTFQPLRKVLRPMLFVLALGAASIASAAPAFPDRVQLGMTAGQLHEAVPALVHLSRPQRLAGGLLGSWSAPPVEVGGTFLVPTFFFAGEVLQRIEYVGTAADGASAFDGVRLWARQQWGRELASEGAEGRYASWSTEDMDVYLQMTSARDRPGLRLVLKRRVLKDASEL